LYSKGSGIAKSASKQQRGKFIQKPLDESLKAFEFNIKVFLDEYLKISYATNAYLYALSLHHLIILSYKWHYQY
jgi:hypothetical protein